ncbi:Ger(x)C family spore germination protein [Paenibacillus sp. GCM10027627]|uniref:Ger(x)C family spore germination protein n=1 Tax=unclassified Paenibacillus TaxID=185978 RepID=UPI0036333EB4
MKQLLLLFLVLPTLLLAGCSDRMELDQSSIVTITGIDLDESAHLTIQNMVLVFNEDAKSKELLLDAKSSSLRKSRLVTQSKSNGNMMIGKLQLILVSKKLLKKMDLFPQLDVAYRDAKVSNSAIIATCDCSIVRLLSTKLDAHPILTEFIRSLIVSGHNSDITVETTMQKFHYFRFEKGINAYISEIKLDNNEISIAGTALLKNDRKYATLLNKAESTLLLILQKDFKAPAIYSTNLTIDGEKMVMSSDIIKASPKIKTAFADDRFQFNIDLPIDLQITELTDDADAVNDRVKIEQLVKEQVDKELSALIRKLQKNKTDPIGLGLYARAFQYKHWKNVQDDWSQAFSEAEITIVPKVTIKRYGVIK